MLNYEVCVSSTGIVISRRNGLLHNTNGPAVIWPQETFRAWYLDGKKHRVDGPAAIWTVRARNPGEVAIDEEWYLNGLRHREDGPAITYFNSREFYIHGQELTEEAFKLQSEVTPRNESNRGE